MARTQGLAAMLARRSGQTVGNPVLITPNVFRTQPGPADTAPLTRNVFPPWVYKLPMSVDFNSNAFDVALAGVVGQQVEITRFQMPPTFVGFLQIMGIFILSPTALQDVTFTLRINGAPVEGWDNIQFPPGVANFVVQTLTATNGSADAWTIGGKIAGWYHPQSEEQRIYGSL
jgi:hypothetical protein